LLIGLAAPVKPWLLIQNKVTPGTVNFTQTWAAYREGFGTATLKDNYWVGNNVLHQLTSSAACRLRVEVTNF
jgi:Fibrinogen beta and gamma chains, C-terminal globular domain